jgi:cytochrome P450
VLSLPLACRKLPTYLLMEALLSFCFISLSTLLLVLWFLKLSSGQNSKPKKQQLPPGPWTLPIIGSLHHVVSIVPHQKITKLCRQYGPLMLLKLGEVHTVVVSGAESAEQVMKTNDMAFAGRPGSPTQDILGGGQGIIFAPYGQHWRQMRKVCIAELLSSVQVRRMEGIRLEEVGSLLRYIAAAAASTGATVNLSEKAMSLGNGVVSRAVFGGKFIQQEDFIRELQVVLTLLGGFCLVDLFPSSRLARWLSFGAQRMKSGYARMQGIIDDVIEGRRKAAAQGCSTDGEDLLGVLLRLQEEDSLAVPLTRDSMCAVLVVSISDHNPSNLQSRYPPCTLC